jgi:hypothetical protein
MLYLFAGIMISEIIQSKNQALHTLGEAIAILFLISSSALYLLNRSREDQTQNLDRYKKKGASLFGNAITLLTVGISMFSAGTKFGIVLIATAVFLGYEGFRTKDGHNFFIPVKRK